MKKITKLKQDYENIEIPSELEDIVKQSIQHAKTTRKKGSPIKKGVLGVAAAAALFVGSINVSPAFARSMVHIPILGQIVDVFTVQTLTVDKGTYQAELKTPGITGLENKDLEAALNEKYIEENKALYQQFEQEVTEMEKIGEGHLGMDAGYEVKTYTEQLLSIARFEVNAVGSSSTTMQYDTLDKQNGVLITLPSLFKDDTYIEVISSYLKDEMHFQMSADDDISYFELEGDGLDFKSIQPDQSFYITENHKLVISFDKYEIAPGYMGIITFEIPSEVLKDVLVSDNYIR
ncbi:RsiV family protein [Sporosarcina sp. A2]|uniref:RsiV family protein n=1 Tax=Sporosarcina sp. A2 TaxID=3393449 RepID=UPI003D7BD2B2